MVHRLHHRQSCRLTLVRAEMHHRAGAPAWLKLTLRDKGNNKNISLNEQIGYDKDGNEITLMDILKTSKPDFALDIHKQNNINLIKKYFNVLNNREKEIIIKRYGLNNEKELTQKEIAASLNISRSYVSRIEKRALTKMLREFIVNKND